MGFFDALGSVGKAVVNTAIVPVDVARDVVTLGGALSDEDETYTGKRARKIGRNLNNVVDEVESMLDD